MLWIKQQNRTAKTVRFLLAIFSFCPLDFVVKKYGSIYGND